MTEQGKIRYELKTPYRDSTRAQVTASQRGKNSPRLVKEVAMS